MYRKSKALNRGTRPEQYLAYQKSLKAIGTPTQAKEFLQEMVNRLANADKHALEDFILYLRQWADDIQFKYYKARCLYTIIPPEDSLAFWLCYTLGSLPEKTRFSSFEGEVLEFLKILELTEQKSPNWKLHQGAKDVLCKELDCALSFLKEEYPVFFHSLTRDPLLVPVLNLQLKSRQGSLLTIPRLHCLGILQPENNNEGLLLAHLHALANILHYSLTEDTKVMPPGFTNMVKQIFDDYQISLEEGGDFFADIFVASLLYETEYMPLIAYMELCREDHIVIRNYFTWLEAIYASSIQDNMLRVIHQWNELRRA